MSSQTNHSSAAQHPSTPSQFPCPRPRPPTISRRRISHVRFEKPIGGDLAGNLINPSGTSATHPPTDPYRPKWQNPLYDGGKIPVDEDHRPSDATLVNVGPPLDHLANFYAKQSSTLSDADLKLPLQAHAPETVSTILPARKRRTIRDRLRRCNSYSEPSQRRDESKEDMKARLTREKRRGFFPRLLRVLRYS